MMSIRLYAEHQTIFQYYQTYLENKEGYQKLKHATLKLQKIVIVFSKLKRFVVKFF